MVGLVFTIGEFSKPSTDFERTYFDLTDSSEFVDGFDPPLSKSGCLFFM